MTRTIHPALLTLLVCPSLVASADVRMPAVFSDHMVLQRQMAIPVWGWADPGEVVEVSFADQTVNTTAGDDGRWRIDLQPLPASREPRILAIQAGNRIEIEDVLIGEVWICGGQSNMEWPVDLSSDASETRENAIRPDIRLINAPHRTSNRPLTDVNARWTVCSPRTVGSMSAVGYAFACDLQDELDVPIGLLSINWGGTRIEPWISADSLLRNDLSRESMTRQRLAIERFDSMGPEDRRGLDAEAKRRSRKISGEYLERQLAADPGMRERLMNPALDDSDWKDVNLPAEWATMDARLREFDGGVWFRRTIDVPADWSDRSLRIGLGAIDDSDVVWFDGTRIGATVEKHDALRNYRVPAGLVKPGPRTITVLAIDSGGPGGFNGPAKAMTIGPIDRMAAIPTSMGLDGRWKWRRGGPHRGGRPATPGDTHIPPGSKVTDYAALHNGMLAPFAPYAVRGAIWYQGESNANEPERYREFLPLLVDDWARAFERDLLPFGIVQLAAFKPFRPDAPVAGDWALIRESQSDAALGSENIGIVITTDIGDAADIHPRNKREVGRRLGAWARGEPAAPRIVGLARTPRSSGGYECRLEIVAPGGSLSTRDGGSPTGFAIAGSDGEFRWADARFEDANRSIVVSHPDVPDPVAVRYAWQSNPENANVVDARGMPLDGWRSDRDRRPE